jgi:hypothetical protein
MTREDYLSSNLGRARTTISRAMHQCEVVKVRLDLVAQALSLGREEALAAYRARESVQDLRIMLAELEALVDLHLAEQKKESD